MIYLGIDVSKDKHDCYAFSSDGEILLENYSFKNNLEGFNSFFNILSNFKEPLDNFKVGLEATGHYSDNLLNFLTSKHLRIYIFNPLHTSLYRKSLSLRKTKTDKLDARVIAQMLVDCNLKPYLSLSYHIVELKSLIRSRFRIIQQRSKAKIQLSRLVTIIFSELEKNVWSISQKSILELLFNFPSKKLIANSDLTKLTDLLSTSSKGKFNKDKAIEIHELAKKSIGNSNRGLSFELKQIIEQIFLFNEQINELDSLIKEIIIELDTPLITIPGISYTLAAYILAEIGDINNFDSPAKVQAFAGLDPSIYQSGHFQASQTKMIKRGSKYLRWALLNATRLVCRYDLSFNDYLQKKQNEGKHYFVALGHCSKKLIRVIFAILKNNTPYVLQK